MDGREDSLGTGPGAAVLPRAQADARDPAVLSRLAAGLGQGPFALILLFVSPEADRAALEAALAGGAFGAAPVPIYLNHPVLDGLAAIARANPATGA